MTKKAIVWSKPQCPQCDTAKQLLAQRGISYEERKIGEGFTKEDLLAVVPSARAVPQIFINDVYVGGVQQLKQQLESTKL